MVVEAKICTYHSVDGSGTFEILIVDDGTDIRWQRGQKLPKFR